MTETLYLPTARYTWGGDEFLFVEFDEAMNLTANYLSTTVAHGLSTLDLPGVVDVCPANASLLVRFDPDVIKAEVHSWLAWQGEPGKPYGQAMMARYFQHDAAVAARFVAWFRRLYGLAA